jgi:iron complex outermembrane receptor protein
MLSKNLLLLLGLFCGFVSFSQVKGRVLELEVNKPVEAQIISSEGNSCFTDKEGYFILQIQKFPVTLITKAEGYLNDTTIVKDDETAVEIRLEVPIRMMEAVVVSAGRRTQKLEDITISMEVLKPALINNKGITSLDQAVNQSPGVFAMDGQVSIRGGGGYAYGAGSRVLLLWNGIPMLSPDVGDVKWNSVALENASQIEVIKGASSVLYGSGALNGIISILEKDPSTKGEFKAKVLSGVYGDPKRSSLKWWDRNPTFYSFDTYYGKSFSKVGYSLSCNGFLNEGYRKGALEHRARMSGSLYYKPLENKNLKAGIFYSGQYQYTGNFILWENDSLGYIAQGNGSTLSYQKSIRVNVDPYLKFTDAAGNKHELKTRYYLVTTGDLTNIFASSKASMYFGNYQFQRQWPGKSVLTAGTTFATNQVLSPVFGNHTSHNSAAYVQYEKKWQKMDFSVGTRAEYFELDGKRGDSDFYFGNDTTNMTKLPVYPILRAGLHYAINKSTHLRASYGQGIRFPSVAERYAATSNGGVVIFPNPSLRPEIGWAAEVGVKQVFRISEWKGMLDVAAFVNQYSNMIEYTFGLYNPDTVVITAENLASWIGFQAQNAESARITGLEFSFNSSGKIRDVEIVSLLGYTYMNPTSLNLSPSYVGQFSDSNSNMLKYRFKHMAKADIEVNYKTFSWGISSRYNSFMSNIDKVFLSDLDPTLNTLFVLPGLADYRERFNTGVAVFDVRMAHKFREKWKFAVIINNLFNAEYTSRPADIQPPRTFMVQLQAEI